MQSGNSRGGRHRLHLCNTMIGRTLIGRYHIVDKIGEGGMALVYKGKDLALNRPVAIKVLRPQYTTDSEFVERFRREAQSAASLSHPNIVNVFDVGEDNGTYFIVMEYVEGADLKDMIHKGRLSLLDSVRIAEQIASGLEHAHSQNLIHRDIKPHNILVTAGGQVKVTDFGIARAVSSATLTQTGIIMGSVHYFSPEQAQGSDTGIQSDIYSVGVVLYEMVTGKLPFEGNSAVSVALKHIDVEATAPRRLNRAIPPELERVIRKCMAKNPHQRYSSAGRLLADLRKVEEVLDGESRMETGARQEDEGFGIDESTKVLRVEPDKQRTRVRDAGEAKEELGDKVAREGKRRPKRRGLYGLIFFVVFVAGFFWALQQLPVIIFPDEVVVPNITGREVSEARAILKDENLRLVVEREIYHENVAINHIVSQDPRPGRQVREHRAIQVVVSKGPEVVQVPDLINLSLRAAELRLSDLELGVGEISYRSTTEVAPDTVVDQSPEPGERMERSGTVDLVVTGTSIPKPTLILPDLRGLQLEVARAEIENLGLAPGHTWQDMNEGPKGIVLDQRPRPGAEVTEGDRIDLIYSAGGEDHLEDGQENTGVDAPADTDDTGEGGASPAPVREGTVTIRIPEGPEREVLIIVIDDLGTHRVYERTHSGGTFLTQTVRGIGKSIQVQVYIDGNLSGQRTI